MNKSEIRFANGKRGYGFGGREEWMSDALGKNLRKWNEGDTESSGSVVEGESTTDEDINVND